MDPNRDRVIQQVIGQQFGVAVVNFALAALVFVLCLAVGWAFFDFLAEAFANLNNGLVVILMVPAAMAAFVPRGPGAAGMVRGSSTHYVLLVCGSGGHTAEMVQMVERSIRAEKSSHRRWAVGKDDHKSYDKIMAFEKRLLDRFSHHCLDSGTFDIVRFGRARHVHQSWLTTPFTAILSLLGIARILTTSPHEQNKSISRYPGVIVTNGPGTGFLFLLVARALKLIRYVPGSRMRTIYVESWARVKSLSLTGRLIRKFRLADVFIAQSRHLVVPGTTLAENFLVSPREPTVPLIH
ncbi:oligosaccharide biosynthesis protein Alg14 like-domain-containing protein [Astrocystis sublimbata]|nr:oligosaccharide biosynthesis protein Alg14 like-domain-containing protein [Astrocystis sublimbata]